MERDRSPLAARFSALGGRLAALARHLPSLLRLAIALALLTSPFWLFPHAGETAYTYEAAEIEYEPGVTGHINVDSPSGLFDRLPCYVFNHPEGLCGFASSVAQHGPVTVNTSEYIGGEYEIRPEYVVVSDSGNRRPFYRWNVTATDYEDDRDDRVTYSLEAVGPETVLRDVAVNESDASPRVRRLLDGETVTVSVQMPPGESLDHDDEVLEARGDVFRSDGSYYLVTRAGSQRPVRSEADARTVRAVLFVAGLVLLRPWLQSGLRGER